jgi:hypothetical protein
MKLTVTQGHSDDVKARWDDAEVTACDYHLFQVVKCGSLEIGRRLERRLSLVTDVCTECFRGSKVADDQLGEKTLQSSEAEGQTEGTHPRHWGLMKWTV